MLRIRNNAKYNWNLIVRKDGNQNYFLEIASCDRNVGVQLRLR
jgi:hypothetical protein